MNCYHGTEGQVQAHPGLCLTQCEASARHYGENVHKFSLDLSGLSVLDVNHLVDRDNMAYPGDTVAEIEEFASKGVDVLVFEDETAAGRSHITYRLVTSRALEALHTNES